MTGAIRYLERKDIDEKKWNYCVRNAVNGRCYGDSDFLDTMSSNWSGLVQNDYEAIMPLTWRQKFGVTYLYQPAFCQQLGVITNNRQEGITDHFLSSIPKKFRYWDIQLNASDTTKAYPMTSRKNFLLSLGATITALRAKYHRNALRNIRKANEAKIEVIENLPVAEMMRLHRARFKNLNRITEEEYRAFENLLGRWSAASMAKIIGAIDRSGELMASSGYLIYKDRLTFIINGNRYESLGNGATHLLKDYIITKYAGSRRLLDFEGSDNPDFARFYQQFGADTCEYYPRVTFNRLPWPLNLLRR